MDDALLLQGRGLSGAYRHVTVLVGDVSDSSRHAEQLEAEEYAELLALFGGFAREIVPRYGGCVARLQGDGLLALFGHVDPDSSDGVRAAQAAIELHAAVGRLRIGGAASANVLRMHSGIHAGSVLLIQGDIERGRFDVVGDVPDIAARLCGLAGPGEILASASSVEQQHPLFKAIPVAALPMQRGRATLSVLRLNPDAIEIAGAGSGARSPTTQGRRRYVTVLFAGIARRSGDENAPDAMQYVGTLEQFRQLACDCVARHGGSVARLHGEGVLALFGHLQHREDDGRRAAEAALDLHAAVHLLQEAADGSASLMQVHTGIHGGLVLMIEGDLERGRFDVVGEVPNTAARLCALAGGGQIMISSETLGPQAHFFEFEALPRCAIRGRSTPLDVVRLHAHAKVQRRIDAAARRGVSGFVGRSDILDTMLAAAGAAHGGMPRALLVMGEAGIGKTRLIEEFASRLASQDFRVLRGYCEGYLGAAPLQPFMHWVREALGWRAGLPLADNERIVMQSMDDLAGHRAAEFEGLTQALLGTAAAAAAHEAVPLRVSVLVEFITLLSELQTLVLVLDDWQWADDASRHALEMLRARAPRMLLLLASRPIDEDDHVVLGVDIISLGPLAPDEAEAAVAAWRQDPFVVQEVLRRSGGSPLFIEELCCAAAAGNDISAGSRHSSATWINSLVASRLERMPTSQVELLRMASVAGNTFAAWLLDRLTEGHGHGPSRAMLESQDFLIPAAQAGMLRFRHGLTRDAVYATVEPALRRDLHLRVANLLEGSVGVPDAFDRLEALSYHFDAAGMAAPAARYAEAAGDKALAAMSLDRARAQYLTALHALDTLPVLAREDKLRWCSIAQRLGQTCVFDPLDVAGSLVFFRRAAALAAETGDENALARARYWLGYVNYAKGRPAEAVRHCEAALAHAQASDDQRLVAQVQATLAQSLASAGLYERAMPLFVQAVESKRQQSRPGNTVAIGSAYTLGRMAYTLGDLGRFDEAEQHFKESLHLLGDKVHSVGASVRELMCAVYLWQGRWEEARAIGLEGADLALRCRSRYLTAMGRALSACGGWASQQDPESLRLLGETTAWIEAKGGAVSTSLNYGWLVEAAVTLGNEALAREHAARLFMRARLRDRHGLAMGCRALARHIGAHGRIDCAWRYLALAERVAHERASLREGAVNLLARAELWAAVSDSRQAKAAASKAGEDFDRMGMPWFKGRVADLLGRL
jgi:class 3 adenylate cyclase/tetratricopeptide (TPR) repeat protein